MVDAGDTADRPANQVARPGCLGLNSRRRDVLTVAPQQDHTAPQYLRRAPSRRRLDMTPRNCGALPSTDPVEILTQASGCGLAESSGWIPPPRYIFQAPKCCAEFEKAYRLRQRRQLWSGWWVRVLIRERRGATRWCAGECERTLSLGVVRCHGGVVTCAGGQKQDRKAVPL